MELNIISPKWHAIADYALAGSLIAAPFALNFNKTARNIYLAEAAVLLPYVALTKQPVAIKGVIPFKTHGKIDVFHVARFAALSMLPAFRKNKKALAFNIAFAAVSAVAILMTDWKGKA